MLATPYPTSTGRTIEGIAAWAREYAAGRDDDSAASAVVSVAVVQVVGPCSSAYSATQGLVGDLMRGHLTGADTARWSLKHSAGSDQHRAEHAARLSAVVDVIEASGVEVPWLVRAVRELRAYAEVYAPNQDR